MHLKRMELFGFKSFAEKSELSLGPGIAVVIGPNGCGKSNLVDAVRWALGEQSVKSLRGTRMEEIIFSGSENRKPLNFAEVSLTFEGAGSFLNLDYNEITITRRLFRNGDSEYYINKSPCRLKDITELFLDTGLGKDVYSVIGQGRVDEIINSRPEERREIFEEAAGIFKYKLRKKEARRRLGETRDNLVRVQDLIYELETQIEPLKGQAEVTRQYRTFQKRIEAEEKKLLSYHLLRSREQLSKVNKQLQSVNDALLASVARGGLHEKEIQDLKNRHQDQQNDRKELEQILNKVSRVLEQKDSELKILLERESRFREQLEQNRQRVEQLDLLTQEYAAQKSKSEQNLADKNTGLEKLNKDLTKFREELSELESSTLAGEVEKIREDIYRAGVNKEAAASAVEELNRRFERLKSQKKSYKEEDASLKEKLSSLKTSANEVEKQLDVLRDLVVSSGEDLERETGGKNKAGQILEKAASEIQKKKENLHGINSRLNLLHEQEMALSGYYRGVKEVLQNRSDLPGIIGPVADLISVNGQYIQAVESALGSSLQYLVAETEKSVKDAIKYLRINNRGWATFLPLDILHRAADPLERYPGWRDLPGVIGKASELVETEPDYRNAIDYLMASILVCRNLDDASTAADFINFSCRVVTLDGEMINPGGIIRGGSIPKRNPGMPLGRRKEIEDLQKQKEALITELKYLDYDLQSAKSALIGAEKKVSSADLKKQDIDGQLSAKQKEFEDIQRTQSNLNDRLEIVKAAYEEIETEESELNQRKKSLENNILNYSSEIDNFEKELAKVKTEYSKFLEEKNELEQKITGVLVQISSFKEQHDSLIGRIREIVDNIKSPTAEIMEKNKEYEKYKKELDEIKESQQRITAELEDLNEEKANLIAELEKKTDQINQIEADLIDLDEQGRRRQSQLSRQEKRERQLSVEQTRLETEINYQEMRYKELFRNLDLAFLNEEFEPEESRFMIENLKEDLEALGEVNLGAIEELARLEERIAFLTEQKEDLQKGETSLHKVLAEIDQRMEYYFKNAFEKINDNFRQTFEELFEGGQVMLRLTDTGNILESGIDIIAQPPGKKLQNITLLSAGEKVLTAIALVFAILRFKPAPFYLLDEVESTLDDANLSRFTRFLKQMAEQAQFIMITHRRRTMEEAEVLYGVTMPEPGISRLISLKIENNRISRES